MSNEISVSANIGDLNAIGLTTDEISKRTRATIHQLEDGWFVTSEAERDAISALTEEHRPQIVEAARNMRAAAPRQNGWSNAARAAGTSRTGCQHYETSNTGICYSCGSYVASDDVSRFI